MTLPGSGRAPPGSTRARAGIGLGASQFKGGTRSLVTTATAVAKYRGTGPITFPVKRSTDDSESETRT